MVDCENVAEFEQNYVAKESQWPEEFRQWMVTSKGRHRSVKDTLQHCMLKTVRIAAGNPPNKWDNQRIESINNNIKEAADNHVTDQATIHEILETRVIQQQENEYIKAIYNMGKYRLAPEFQKFSVTPVAWSQKTPERQREHVRKVLFLGEVPVLPSLEETKITKRLSVTVEESRLTTVAAGMLNQIWHEAERILSRHEIMDLGEGVHCVTECRNSVNVVCKRRGSGWKLHVQVPPVSKYSRNLPPYPCRGRHDKDMESNLMTIILDTCNV